MGDSIWKIIKQVASSRIGQLLFALSLCFVLVELAPRFHHRPLFVGCIPSAEEVYTISEILVVRPIWVVVISVLYIPSAVLTSSLMKLLSSVLLLSCVPTARLEFAILLISSSIQWWVIGYSIERLVKRRRM
jgi:hypothetical protein